MQVDGLMLMQFVSAKRRRDFERFYSATFGILHFTFPLWSTFEVLAIDRLAYTTRHMRHRISPWYQKFYPDGAMEHTNSALSDCWIYPIPYAQLNRGFTTEGFGDIVLILGLARIEGGS